MVKKLRCTITGNLIYVTPKRYARILAKYGDEEAIKSSYVSMIGRKIKEGSLDEPKDIKNRIRCTISGKWCYITNQRISVGIAKYGSLESLNEHYVCRAAARLLREGKTADEIKQMVGDGSFPEK